VRSARRLLRRKERVALGRFLAEGRQAVSEALRRPGTVLDLLVGADVVERHQDLLDVAVRAGVDVATVTPAVLATLTDTVTPQGIVAVCATVDVALHEALSGSPRLVVLCDQVRDPGNLGTVVRCADAFGADAVLVSTDSVDVHNSKTVRASTGSLFHLPVAVEVDLAGAVDRARGLGMAVLGADGAGAQIDELAATGQLSRPVLWVMGNEAWGLPAEHAALMDALVALPMYGRAESLNLSTAAAVFLYATATAQRTPDARAPRSEPTPGSAHF
jgi:TrmH family RNA methyltransferase